MMLEVMDLIMRKENSIRELAPIEGEVAEGKEVHLI